MIAEQSMLDRLVLFGEQTDVVRRRQGGSDPIGGKDSGWYATLVPVGIQPDRDRPPVPFTVIGGFLGAGKTTLVNHVLRHTDERIAVLVNDFGTTVIDADLVAEHDGDTIALANGCVCCSIGGELALALLPLLDADPPFDRIVTEASGVAEPRSVAQYGMAPGLRLDGVVVVADAASLTATLDDGRIGDQVGGQLRQADLIVLNKIDAADRSRIADADDALARLAPDVPIIHAADGRVPLGVLFGLETAPITSPRSETAHEHDFDSVVIATTAPVDRELVDDLVSGLPPELVRAKGVIGDLDGGAWLVHVVGPTSKITAFDAPTEAASFGRIVLIGFAGAFDGYHPPAPFVIDATL